MPSRLCKSLSHRSLLRQTWDLTIRPSPICSGLASITRRLDTARRTSGRTTPTCRFTRCGVPLSRCRIALITTAAPYKPGRRRPGTGSTVQRESEVLHRLFRRFDAGPRPSHFARRHRPPAHDGGGPRHLLPAGRTAPSRSRRAGRIGGAALSRRADESQPARDAGEGLSRDRRPLQGGRRRRGDPGAQLPCLPSDPEPRRARARRTTASPRSSWDARRTSSSTSASRVSCSPISRWAMARAGPGRAIAGHEPRARIQDPRERARAPRRPFNRRSSGARIPIGSSTTATSSASRRRRSAQRRADFDRGKAEAGRCAR